MDLKCLECKYNETAICNKCDMCYDQFEPIETPTATNADRIRAMSDEELAEYFANVAYDFWAMFVADPKKVWLDWLKREVGE